MQSRQFTIWGLLRTMTALAWLLAMVLQLPSQAWISLIVGVMVMSPIALMAFAIDAFDRRFHGPHN